MQKAIFLDRDGTLNYDSNYVYRLEDLIILDGVKEWLAQLRAAGYLLIIVTNQSGINRGYYTYEQFEIFTHALAKQVDINFDEIYCCRHTAEENCLCRKPNNFFLLEADKQFGIDFSASYFLWDKDKDILCGKSVWCKTILIGNDPSIPSDFQTFSFLAAVDYILWLSPH